MKRLPAANEFSPGQLGGIDGLRRLLTLVANNSGDADAAKEAVREEFFSASAEKRADDPEAQRKQQLTRSYNAILGASTYGLVDLDSYKLTSFGETLLSTDSADRCADELAEHILKELHGLEVLETVRSIQARGERVTKTSLQAALERGGFSLPRATTHHTKLLNWLETAHVVGDNYAVDDVKVGRLAGITVGASEEWQELTTEQQGFLRVMRKLALPNGTEPIPAKEIVDAAEAQGQVFSRPDQLRRGIFDPLVDTGWIEHAGVGKGRGGKSGTVAATEKLLEADLDLIPEETGAGIPPDLRSQLRRPLDEIYADLDSEKTYDKGIALELLALRIAFDLGLTPIKLRERGTSTGGAEVDLISEADHLHFSRWLIQCKNTQTVNVAALAKEIGMAVLLNAHVVVLVTTGAFSSTVIEYADQIGITTPLQVVLVPGPVLNRYRDGGAPSLRDHFHQIARQTLELKRPQVEAEPET